MAIVIEEEQKNRMNPLTVATWVVVIIIIGLAAYYVFFSQPELVEVAVPPSIQNIDPLSRVNINPEDVVNGPVFQSLKPTIAEPTPTAPAGVGRSNPFLMP